MRVKAHLEHQPRLPFRGDYDYFGQLHEMQGIFDTLQRIGRCLPLMLDKASRYLRFGAFPQAITAANSAIEINRNCSEAYWLRALAFLGLSLNRLGILDLSPAIRKQEIPAEPAMEYVEEARSSLGRCIMLSQERDQEAVDLLDYLDSLGSCPRDAALRDKLRPLLA